MEFLSAEYNASSDPVNLVLQSPESEEDGFNAASTGTFQTHKLPFNPSGAFHEYRFGKAFFPLYLLCLIPSRNLEDMFSGV